MLFSELLPDHLFADNKMLYLAPPVIHGGKVNTAVVAGDISLPSNLIALQNDYAAYCRRPGAKAYYGAPENFYHMVGEKQMRAMLGQPGEAAWLSPARDEYARHFAMGAQVNQRRDQPRLFRPAYAGHHGRAASEKRRRFPDPHPPPCQQHHARRQERFRYPLCRRGGQACCAF